jgi:hypothetical protein
MGGSGVHSHGVKARRYSPERYNNKNRAGWLWSALPLNLIGVALHDSFTLVSAIDLQALGLQWLPPTNTVTYSLLLPPAVYLYWKI